MPNTCETCRHWFKIPATRSILNDCVGECRRRAPHGSRLAEWPRSKAVDFCSEFESKAVAFATTAPEPAPAPAAGELPLSLGTGPAAPTSPDAAKSPAGDAPGSTRQRRAKASPTDTSPAGAE